MTFLSIRRQIWIIMTGSSADISKYSFPIQKHIWRTNFLLASNIVEYSHVKGNGKEIKWGTFRKRKISQKMEKQKRVFISNFKVLEILEVYAVLKRTGSSLCLLIITESLLSNGEPPATLTFAIWLDYGNTQHENMP